MEKRNNKPVNPPLWVAFTPILFLLASLIVCILTLGADRVLDLSPWLLLTSAVIAVALCYFTTSRTNSHLLSGLRKSARQIIPAYPILLLIGTLSATWMISGVVPMLIDYGVHMLYPAAFLPLACIVCALVSVMTGSSWTTIATIGVAFMGIGAVMGYPAPWIAGAIISGAYFGDKVSPLSDTTVLASSTVGVDLFTHIRSMLITTVPAICIALVIYAIMGYRIQVQSEAQIAEISEAIRSTFNITPWLLTVPAITCILIIFKANTVVTLGVSTLAGLVSAIVFQPELFNTIIGQSNILAGSLGILINGSELATGNEILDPLLSTSGAMGMMPTVWLVTAAMMFGGAMIGTGMLSAITTAAIKRLRNRLSLISSTVAGGCFLNLTTGDQYISLIIGGNMFHSAYRTAGIRPRILSRSLEDSISVTSVLIPWNSCGMTQSTVLGIATVAYAPFCIFNILSPIMSICIAAIGSRMSRRSSEPTLA